MASRVTYEAGKLRAYTDSLPQRADRLAGALAARGEGYVKENIVAQDVIDTGAGLNSAQHRREALAVWLIFVGMPYMVYHEFGTYKMRARPFFIPAMMRLMQEIGPLAKVEFAP